MTKSEIQKRYYEKHKDKCLSYILERQKLPEVRRRKNERKRENRKNNVEKTKREYEMEKLRKKRSPFKKLVNITNSNQNKKFKGNYYKLKAFDLWKIAKKQKLKCPFTGEKLTTDNISLDHIIPVSKGGDNNPFNIRLVLKWINLMRLNYSDEEFIVICKKVSDFRKID